MASTIFRIVDATEDPDNHNTYLGKNGVAWVLRFGGLCTLVSAEASDISAHAHGLLTRRELWLPEWCLRRSQRRRCESELPRSSSSMNSPCTMSKILLSCLPPVFQLWVYVARTNHISHSNSQLLSFCSVFRSSCIPRKYVLYNYTSPWLFLA